MATKGITISPVNMEDRKSIGIKAGDTVRVWQKIQEKGKTRLQAFEGLVLARKHGSEPGATFTVRRVASGVGVEKIFPLYSPMIDKIEIVRRSRVRRAKLYYIREKVAREIRRQMRNMRMMDVSTVSDTAEKAKAEEDAQAAEENGDTSPDADTSVESEKDESSQETQPEEKKVEESEEEAKKEVSQKEEEKKE